MLQRLRLIFDGRRVERPECEPFRAPMWLRSVDPFTAAGACAKPGEADAALSAVIRTPAGSVGTSPAGNSSIATWATAGADDGDSAPASVAQPCATILNNK
jgi:hypothetical protein